MTFSQIERRESHTLEDGAVDDFCGPWSAPGERKAIVAGEKTLTYADLERQIAQIAGFLTGLNLEPGVAVGVVLPQGYDSFAAVLGVLRAGLACFPLPTDPGVVDDFVKRGAMAAILARGPLVSQLSRYEALEIHDLDLIDSTHDPILSEISPNAPALVLRVPESAAVSLSFSQIKSTVDELAQIFHRPPGDTLCLFSQTTEAELLMDWFLCLAVGGTLVLPPAEALDGDDLHALVAGEKVTIWHTTPGLAQRLVHFSTVSGTPFPKELQTILLSGDWMPGELPDQLLEARAGLELIYLSGSAESGIHHAINQGATAGEGTLFLGKALTGRTPLVLNERGDACPPWVPGKLFLAGEGLARAWPLNPTSQPVRMGPGKGGKDPLFATNDLVRSMPGGQTIELLGTVDNRLEIQGADVFVHQVEHALCGHDQIRGAVVVGATAGGPLVAFVVPHGERAPDRTTLDTFLAESLPEQALPARYVTMEDIPITPRGVTDREALRHIARQAAEPEPAQEDDTPTYETGVIIQRFSQKIAGLLEAPAVDPDANLLDLGINSVDLIRIANDLESEFGFRPNLETFFREPTIEALARQYQETLGETSFQEPYEAPKAAAGNRPPSQIIMDPDARDTFKKKRHALRRDLEGKTRIHLDHPPIGDGLRELYARRRSVREFLLNPIPLDRFSQFLSVLREIELEGNPKYRYASAGGLYPVQTYLYVKPGRVQGLEAGAYYYHPIEHRLTLLYAGADLHRDAYGWINKPIFDQGGFCLFLVGQLKAIEPMYGSLARDFSMYEAGSMGQLLMMAAPDFQLGLCGIGALREEDIPPLLALDEGHEILHSFVGGLIDSDTPSAAEGELAKPTTKQEKITRVLEKMDKLSSEEVKALLEEKKKNLNRS